MPKPPKPRSDRLKKYLVDLSESVHGFEELDFKDINQRTNAGETALHRAVFDQEDVEIIRELIEQGIEINAVAEGDLNLTALHNAVSKGDHETIELLIDNGANVFAIDDLHGQPPFFSAMLKEKDDLVHLIMRRIFGLNGESGQKKIDQSWLEFHQRQVARIQKNMEDGSNDT